jgi:quercetin 2,3-dioxygenase
MEIDVKAARERFHTEIGWLDSWHSFSFSQHYDPRNTHHGVLLVSNDDRVAPSSGFGDHPHRDMEIVTWVLSGSLRHRDSVGNDGVIEPGIAQRMRAGTGIVHAELNPSASTEVHLVQMWVPPGTLGLEPGYEEVDVSNDLDAGGLVAVAAGPGGADAATSIDTPGTTLWAGRLDAGGRVTVPAAPFVHVFVALGSARLGEQDLAAGDAVRLADAGALALVAGDQGAEVLVWEMHATIAPDGRRAIPV